MISTLHSRVVRFRPADSFETLYQRQAAQIRHFCQQNIEGIFSNIPSQVVADALLDCRSLNIPVIAKNAGLNFASELEVPFIGQNEVRAGYAAGERLVEAGMKRALCVVHEPNNVVLLERCSGFEQAPE